MMGDDDDDDDDEGNDDEDDEGDDDEDDEGDDDEDDKGDDNEDDDEGDDDDHSNGDHADKGSPQPKSSDESKVPGPQSGAPASDVKSTLTSKASEGVSKGPKSDQTKGHSLRRRFLLRGF
ncbi:hypothetical protein K7432_018379 [Basidiobolus ranarum]|uniref:Uncharacterized protein n=1 Tax=Basidiobolus ranarum TaxID=34480 RepID=A0ABR2VKE2_9FUNG